MEKIIKSIRVFISSTFLDMQDERDYLNRVIFPKLELYCKNHGVSFFGCDLRWGISDAEAQNKETMGICLRQIENCIPFFIGLVGNRYGWIPQKGDVDTSIYSFFKPEDELSATELEFVQYTRLTKRYDNCFFACKAEGLLDETYADHEKKLRKFRKRIVRTTGRELFKYASIEELGAKVYETIKGWVDNAFPKTDIAMRMGHYCNLLKEREREHDILERWQRKHIDETDVAPSGTYNPYKYATDSIMGYEMVENAFSRYQYLCLCEPRGSEFIINRYVECVLQGKKRIKIYLDAIEELRDPQKISLYIWEALKDKVPAVYNDVIRKMNGEPTSPEDVVAAIRLALCKIEGETLWLCVTNLHLLCPDDPDYLVPFFNSYWGENIKILLTTNDRSQAALLNAMGKFVVINFPVRILDEGKALLVSRLYLSLLNSGKKAEPFVTEEILSASRYADDDVNLLQSFLVRYAVYSNFREIFDFVMSAIKEGNSVSDSILSWSFSKLDARIKECAVLMLGVLKRVPCEEYRLFNIFKRGLNIPRESFNKALDAIRPVLDVTNDGLFFSYDIPCEENAILKDCIVTAVKDYIFERLHEKSGRERIKIAYILLNYLFETKDPENVKRFVTDEYVLRLAISNDCNLVRRGWIFLVDCDEFDVKKLYPQGFSSENYRRSYALCDLIMKLENSLFGDSEMEYFLDIPYYYSTDIEEKYKSLCSIEEKNLIYEILQRKKEGTFVEMVDRLTEYIKGYGVSSDFNAYAYEALINYRFENKIEIDDAALRNYIYFASRNGNARMIANALSIYYCMHPEKEDVKNALSRLKFYQVQRPF